MKIADMKGDEEAQGTAFAAVVEANGLLADGSYYVCFEASNYLMYSAAAAVLGVVSIIA